MNQNKKNRRVKEDFGIMADTVVETDISVLNVANNNIIICKKHVDVRAMSQELQNDVNHIENELTPTTGTTYALKLANSNLWSRAVVKFIRNDGVIVLQSIDMPGVFDFTANVSLRRIQSAKLKNLKPAVFKLMIYGIAKYEPDREFMLIFEQTIKKEKLIVISYLIEPNANITNQCYAGDVLFNFNNQYRSFREVLVREKISYPARIQDNINQLIFQRRTQFLLDQNKAISIAASTLCFVESKVAQSQNQDGALSSNELIDGKFILNRIIGEGSVSG